MCRIYGVLTILLTAMATIAVASGNRGATAHWPAGADLKKALLSDDELERSLICKAWRDRAFRYSRDLVDVIRQDPVGKGFSTSRECAALMLGELRAPSGAEVLIENIEYEQRFKFITEYSPLCIYPCAMALRHMDLNAVPEIMWHLRQTEPAHISDMTIELLARVVNMIYGFETEKNGGFVEAVSAVDRFMARTPVESRGNLQRLKKRMHELSEQQERS